MGLKSLFVAIILMLIAATVRAQPCSALGQVPASAFPVCGNTTFSQSIVGICGTNLMPTRCSNGPFLDKNPYWYKFTCFTTGTLGFVITPIVLSDDYDWQLFDVTGRNPNDVFTDLSMLVAENWSGASGATGASPLGSSLTECGGNFPIWCSMPTIVAGRDYLLMVSHWTNTQTGYDLSFTGGSAIIADPVTPLLQSATVNCYRTQITVRLNKKIKCNSLTTTGSEFSINPAATIISAGGFGCSNGFEFDSLLITVSAPLAPGNYTLLINNGTDANTLLDNCDRAIAPGNGLSFVVDPVSPLAMGTIAPPACAPTSVTIDFPEPILCSSIAANGSDFIITGPGAVTVTGATANCNPIGQASSVTINFAGSISVAGNYNVQMVTGSDANTVLGNCNRQVNPGDLAPFTIAAQTSLPMGTIAPPTCAPTTIAINFTDAINCSSIAANGSDFVITGPSAVTVTGATFVCNGSGQTNLINIQLSSPITIAGNYQVQMATGSDANTLLGVCNRQVNAGETAAFTISPQLPLPMGTITPPPCLTPSITINFPEPVLCGTIAGDGSDFIITGPTPVTITSASPTCNAAAETNSITITFAIPVNVSGNYQVQVKNGTDGNTLLGTCFRQVNAGDVANFSIPLMPSVTMTSIDPPACAPTTIRLRLSGPAQCRSIAPDGSDFTILGPSPVTITSATAACTNGMSSAIDLQLSAPISVAGNYTLRLWIGSDGTTLLSDCEKMSQPATINFPISDTVSAVFSYQEQSDCNNSNLSFTHPGGNGVNSWTWVVNNSPSSNQAATFSQVFPSTSNNTVQLTVSNGVCTASTTQTIILNNKVVIDFEIPDNSCPEDSVQIINNTSGNVSTWSWDFGNSQTSNLQHPPLQSYPNTGNNASYTISLTADNNNGCRVTGTKTLRVLATCMIAVPSGFTPNNDGLNDFLYPLNAFKADKLIFRVFNRWGQLLFETTDWRKKWDGRYNGVEQPTGIFAWTLSYTDRSTGKSHSSNGTTMLIR